MLLFEQSRVPNNHRKNNSCTNDVFRSRMIYESRHEAQSKGKLWLSGGRKVYSSVTSIPRCAEGWMITETNKKSLQRTRINRHRALRDENKGSQMVKNGEKGYLGVVPTESSMTDQKKVEW